MTNNNNRLFQAALEVQDFFEFSGWKFVFIGGLAVIRWGELRTTIDVDGTLWTEFIDDEKYINAILASFKSRITGALSFAIKSRMLLLFASNGVSIDISLGGLQFELQMIERSSLYEFESGYVLRTCSAEDLIVLKAFADRDKDWIDVRSILLRQKGKLDLQYINENLSTISELKESPNIMTKLHKYLEN
ncbi:MAG: nucleotidyltransferase [Planctomycetaceae bacterium]|jgi:predicted nucleotidyltransferase|nr:nucleotidyltransferase [Planctomycetaceae bacterium]